MKFAHLQRLTDPPLLTATTGLAVTTADIDRCKGGLLWERLICRWDVALGKTVRRR